MISSRDLSILYIRIYVESRQINKNDQSITSYYRNSPIREIRKRSFYGDRKFPKIKRKYDHFHKLISFIWLQVELPVNFQMMCSFSPTHRYAWSTCSDRELLNPRDQQFVKHVVWGQRSQTDGGGGAELLAP